MVVRASVGALMDVMVQDSVIPDVRAIQHRYNYCLGKYCQKLQFLLFLSDVWWEGLQLSVWNWLFSSWTTC